MASALDAVVASIGQVLSGLSATIGTLTNNISSLAGPVINNLSNSLGNLTVNFNQFTTNVLTGLTNAINALSNNLNNFANQFNNIAPAFGKITESVQTIIAPISFSIAMFDGLVKVISSVKDNFLSLAKATNQYVKAFSPVAAKIFENALYDLQAVIGSLLLPILESFTTIIRATADSLIPIVQKLRPAFEQIAKVIVSMAVPILNSFFNLLDKLTPIISKFANVFGPLAIKISEFFALFADELGNIAISIAESFLSLSETLMPVIDALISFGTMIIPYTGEMLTLLASAVVGVTTALLISFIPAIIAAGGALWTALSPILVPALLIAGAFYAVVKAIKFFTGSVDKNRKQEKKDLFRQTNASVGFGARQAQYQSVEDLSRTLIASAFGQGASIEKQMLNVEKEQLEVLQKIAANQKPGGPLLQPRIPGVGP